MKYYLLENLNQIQSFSKRITEKILLKNNQWKMINDKNFEKTLFIFNPNGALYISTDGDVNKNLNWEYLSNGDIIIDFENQSNLFKSDFLDDTILALRKDNTNLYLLLVNESKYGETINSYSDIITYINNKYNIYSEIPYDEPNYVSVHDKCPACGYVGLKNEISCPECEILFR
jgi:hypothetical protein